MARRNPNPNKTKIVNIARQYNDDVEAYRRFAEGRRNSTKYTQELLTEFYDRMKQYFYECKETKTPPTIGKLCIALGISKTSLHEMRKGEHDYRLPQYMDLHGVCYEDIRTKEDEFFKGFNPLEYWIDSEGKEILLMTYSEIMLRGIAYIEAEVEETILKGQKPVGSIFYAKSVFGYSDAPDRGTPMQEHPRIADRAEATEALDNLIDEESIKRAILMLESDKLEKRTAEKLSEMQKESEG